MQGAFHLSCLQTLAGPAGLPVLCKQKAAGNAAILLGRSAISKKRQGGLQLLLDALVACLLAWRNDGICLGLQEYSLTMRFSWSLK